MEGYRVFMSPSVKLGSQTLETNSAISRRWLSLVLKASVLIVLLTWPSIQAAIWPPVGPLADHLREIEHSTDEKRVDLSPVFTKGVSIRLGGNTLRGRTHHRKAIDAAGLTCVVLRSTVDAEWRCANPAAGFDKSGCVRQWSIQLLIGPIDGRGGQLKDGSAFVRYRC